MERPRGTFTDAAGNVWPLRFALPDFDRVRSETGFDFLSTDKLIGQAFIDRYADPRQFAALAWAILSPQAAAKSIDQAAFLAAFTGDAVDDCCRAIVEAWEDYFPNWRKTPIRTLAIGVDVILSGEAMTTTTSASNPIPTTDQEIRKTILAAIAEAATSPIADN